MSPEHDNNLQPTLEMSASEPSSEAPQTATSQAKDILGSRRRNSSSTRAGPCAERPSG